MFKNLRRRYMKYRFDRRYDYPFMFGSIDVTIGLIKLLGVCVVGYGVYYLVFNAGTLLGS